MKIVAVCVRDMRAGLFWNPMFTQTLGEAVRAFEDQVNRAEENNLLYKHPQDFELYHLGTFDTSTAQFEILERPQQIMDAQSAVRKARQETGTQLRAVE